MAFTDAIHYQCLIATQTRLRLLTFPPVKDPETMADVDLASTSIEIYKIPLARLFLRRDLPLPLPCILITPEAQTMDPTKGTTDRDDVICPCLATCVCRDNAEPTLQLNQREFMKWHELIARAFRNQHLPGVTGVWTSSVKPFDVVLPAAWPQNLLVTALSLNFLSREPRGLNV